MLSKSYDTLGIRVETEEDMDKAFAMADKNRKAPTIIEFIIDERLNVSPMVPGGKPLNEMIMEC